MSAGTVKKEAKQLIGKHVVAYKKDGSVVSGKLLKINGNRLYMQPESGKKVRTKAIIPLVLFDLLAIGTAPYGYSNYGYGYAQPGYGGYNYAYGNYGSSGYPGYPPGYFF
ncbi:hypothetical protein DCC85_06590 [Paenibacillus sp. CAA11]|uniref:hypothetical protein n=1 Tax=Paenibacillus sp. CAA11 TaxID=1532905 RepID=UPI000D33F6D3|nr:hypothetical protein [Paenibacillus sp. CAA11]AWB43921.1 hypothetical protein DCC85_06590 [Paenibacillus sp. CAA11]